MKKIVAICLLLSVLLMTACGTEPSTPTDPVTTTPTPTTPTATTPVNTTPASTPPADTTPVSTTPVSTTPATTTPSGGGLVLVPENPPEHAQYHFPWIEVNPGSEFEWKFSVLQRGDVRFSGVEDDLAEIVSVTWEEWEGHFATATVTLRASRPDVDKMLEIVAEVEGQSRVIPVRILAEGTDTPPAVDTTPAVTTPTETTPTDTTRPPHVPDPATPVDQETYYSSAVNCTEGDTVEWKFSVPAKGDITFSSDQPDAIEVVSTTWEEWEGYFATATVTLRMLGRNQSVTVTASVGGKQRVLTCTIGALPTPPEPSDVLNNEIYYVGPGDLLKDIQVDKREAFVYLDDTFVTYTIVTDSSVDQLEIALVANGRRIIHTPKSFAKYEAMGAEYNDIRVISTLTIRDTDLSDTMTFDPISGKMYSATKRVEDDRTVWTVGIDFGYTAVEYVRIRATDTDTEVTHPGYARLNIQYPIFEASTAIEDAIYLSVKLNLNEPVLFQVDADSMSEYQRFVLDSLGWMFLDEQHALYDYRIPRSEMLAGEDAAYLKIATVPNDELYDAMMKGSPVWRRNFTPGIGFMKIGTLVLNSDSTAFEREAYGAEDKLISNDPFNRTFVFYCPITVDTRAIIAYLEGYEIEPAQFPVAHSVYTNAVRILEEVIEDGMTDFEKARAIYATLYNIHASGYKPLPDGLSWDTLVEGTQEHYDLYKTAYGLLNGYGGDCSGWSASYFVLCNMAGVPCTMVEAQIVVGDEVGGPVGYDRADHRFNLVQIDGEYYFVDAFWSYQGAAEEGVYYDFLMTDEVAAKSYKWLDEDYFGPPTCNYTTYLVDPFTGERLNP
ncbi:MAG: hypothetical protein J6D21_04065 [Clostridia bacterium]|nr:hypothetical protein [Clostridia bacterium]